MSRKRSRNPVVNLFIDAEWYLNQRIFLIGYAYEKPATGDIEVKQIFRKKIFQRHIRNMLNFLNGDIYVYGPDVGMLEKRFDIPLREKFTCINMMKVVRHLVPHSFFILNKGLNSGKPMHTPCPNCFVLTTEDDASKNRFYWLCFALWQSKRFHPLLRGSVIEFIVIDETRRLIEEADRATNGKDIGKLLDTLNSITTLQTQSRGTETLPVFTVPV